MSTTSRRGFLKGFGATLAGVGVTAAGLTAAQPTDAARSRLIAGGTAIKAAGSDEGTQRMYISPYELSILVAEHLNQWVATAQPFTAYDVTRALRSAHPRYDIFHHDVRSIVHQRMQPLVMSRFYAQQTVMYRTGSAIRYVPC